MIDFLPHLWYNYYRNWRKGYFYMLTKRNGENYIIAQEKNDKYPIEINQKVMDESLKTLQDALVTIADLMQGLYNDGHYNLYHLFNDHIFAEEFDSGDNWGLNDSISFLKELEYKLTTDDEITPFEELETLEDRGYKSHPADKRWYERIIEDSDKREVVDEICWDLSHRNPLRRRRTIIWEKTDYGRKSKTIEYEKLPIDNSLMKCIRNTQ